MRKPESVMIKELVVPGTHGHLIEALTHYPRKTGNQFVLSLSEACIDMWPLTLADYQMAEDVNSQRVKITINAAKYPRLFNLYQALPFGLKGITFINLLNRHLIMRETEPEKANDALTRLLTAKTRIQAGERLVEVIGPASQGGEAGRTEVGRSTLSSPIAIRTLNGLNPEVPASQIVESVAPLHEVEATQTISTSFFERDAEDPLAALPTMSFGV